MKLSFFFIVVFSSWILPNISQSWIDEANPNHLDAKCDHSNSYKSTEWTRQINATVVVAGELFLGNRSCTGTLIKGLDGDLYLLSAKHCINPNSHIGAKGGVTVFLNHESQSCDKKELPINRNDIAAAQLLWISNALEEAHNLGSDLALVRLSPKSDTLETSALNYSDMLLSTVSKNQNVVGLHHPRGDLKKVSLGQFEYIKKCNEETCAYESGNYQTGEFYSVEWSHGFIEGGSSGAPLFDKNKKIIGVASSAHNHTAQTWFNKNVLYAPLKVGYETGNLQRFLGNDKPLYKGSKILPKQNSVLVHDIGCLDNFSNLVRECEGSNQISNVVSRSNMGEVISGPKYGSKQTWWEVQFDIGVTGWVDQDDIKSYQPINSTTSSHQTPIVPSKPANLKLVSPGVSVPYSPFEKDTGHVVGNQRVRLTAAAKNATHYDFFLTNVNNESTSIVCAKTKNKYCYVDVIPGNFYRWNFRAYNGSIQALASDRKQFIYLEDTQALSPGGTSSTSRTSVSTPKPKFSWKYVNGAQFYNLNVKGPSGLMPTVKVKASDGKVSGNTFTYSFPKTLSPGSYKWDVQACVMDNQCSNGLNKDRYFLLSFANSSLSGQSSSGSKQLNVPYFSQHNTNYPDDACLGTNVAMLMAQYGLISNDKLKGVAEELYLASSNNNTSDVYPHKLADYLKAKNYFSSVNVDFRSQNLTKGLSRFAAKQHIANTIKAEIDAGRSIVVGSQFTSASHYISVIGYYYNSREELILVVNDPNGSWLENYRGRISGKGLHYPLEKVFALRNTSYPTLIRLSTNQSSPAATVIRESDLIVNGLKVDDTTLSKDQRFKVYANVKNQGKANSDKTRLNYYLSKDSRISTSDTFLDSDYVRALSQDGVSSESQTLNAPSISGTYYIGACVASVKGESNTANNCSTSVKIKVDAGSSTVSTASNADLVVLGLKLDDSSLSKSQRFKVYANVKNAGKAKSDKTRLNYYLSKDSTVNTSDKLLDSDYVKALSQNRISGENEKLNAPSISGTYYIGACVLAVKGESNTANNCSKGVKIKVAAGSSSASSPDLIVEGLKVDDSSLSKGQRFRVYADVKNIGKANSDKTRLNYYLSRDSKISISDDRIDSDYVKALKKYQISRENERITAPTRSGTYYIGACVESVSGESSKSNNCSSGKRIRVK